MGGFHGPTDIAVHGTTAYLPDPVSKTILSYMTAATSLIEQTPVGVLPNGSHTYRVAYLPGDPTDGLLVGIQTTNHTDWVRRYDLGTGGVYTLIDTEDLGGGDLADLVVADDGTIYVLTWEYVGGSDPVQLNVLAFEADGTPVGGGDPVVTDHLPYGAQDATMELGPGGRLYVTNSPEAAICVYNLDTGAREDTLVSGAGSLLAPSFVTFRPPTYSYTAVTDSDDVLAGIVPNVVGGELVDVLLFMTMAGYQGTAQVTVIAHDAKGEPGAVVNLATRGRDAEITFNLHGGTGGIYGTKFDDLDGDGERGFSEPWTLTDANGNYAFADVDFGHYVVAETPQDHADQTFPPPGTAIGSAVLLDADFEQGEDGITIENTGGGAAGLWRRSDYHGGEAGHGGTWSFYFGREPEYDYDVGTTAGRITTPEISLVGATDATLSFNYLLDVEWSTSFDWADVYVSTGGSTWVREASRYGVSHPDLYEPLVNDADWHGVSVDLEDYLGETIRIKFEFDTIDDSANAHEGWLVDDIEVAATLAAPGVHAVLIDDDDPIADGLDFGNRQIIDAGPDQQVDEGDVVELDAWVADLEVAYLLEDIHDDGSSSPSWFAEYNGDLYFAATGSQGRELYVWDGSDVDVALDLAPGSMGWPPYAPYSSMPQDMTYHNGRLYMAATSSQGDRELVAWSGGSKVSWIDVNEDGGSNPYGLVVFDNAVYFGASDGIHGQELFRVAGTTPVLAADIREGSSSSPGAMTPYNGRLFFQADDGVHGDELFCFDPDPAVAYNWFVGGGPYTNPSGYHNAHFKFTPTDADVYAVTLTVTVEGTGDTYEDRCHVFSSNVLPTIEAGPDAGVGEGKPFTRPLTINDPGDDDWTVTVSWGDGIDPDVFTRSHPDRDVEIAHTYPDDGEFPVTVTVEADGEDGVYTDTFTITVGEVPPSIGLQGYDADEG
ncbi:MAG: PKD domain-containing protein, partial [Planctomycetota bacterium]|nr:PKD domain-containing protein [Planctomycetota bacterium]